MNSLPDVEIVREEVKIKTLINGGEWEGSSKSWSLFCCDINSNYKQVSLAQVLKQFTLEQVLLVH